MNELEVFNAALRARLEGSIDEAEAEFDDGSLEDGSLEDGDRSAVDAPLSEAERIASAEAVQALGPMTEALRGRLEARLEASSLEPLPGPPAVGDSPAAGRPVRPWRRRVAMAVAVAACFGAVGYAVATLRPSLADGVGGGSRSRLAVDQIHAGGEVADATARAEDPGQEAVRADHAPLADVQPEPAPPPEEAPEPALPSEATPEPEQETPEPSAPVDIDARIARLDARAQARWREGDLDGARKDFETIVAIGGRRRAVEVAYSELFSLARQQRRDPSGYWTAYLRKFPTGRYAEDAKADLCRTRTADAAARCWDGYAAAFPEGIHGPK